MTKSSAFTIRLTITFGFLGILCTRMITTTLSSYNATNARLKLNLLSTSDKNLLYPAFLSRPPGLQQNEPRYMFLHDSDEQYNAGKRTVVDFAHIAVLSGYIPVMPFISDSSSAFVGHINDPRASSLVPGTDSSLSVGRIPTLFEDYVTAMNFCKEGAKDQGRGKIALVHFNRSNYGSNHECCPPLRSPTSKNLLGAKKLWSADSHSCMNVKRIDIATLSNLPTNCLVLQNFRGLWSTRSSSGKILMNTIDNNSGTVSSSPTTISLQKKRAKLWDDTRTILDRYHTSWTNSNGPVSFAPSSSYLVKAAHCLDKWSTMDSFSSNMAKANSVVVNKRINSTNPIYDYHVLQLRLETVVLGLTTNTIFSVAERRTAIEACLNQTIDLLISDIQHNHDLLVYPIVLMGDFGEHGSKTMFKKDRKNSSPSTDRMFQILESKLLHAHNDNAETNRSDFPPRKPIIHTTDDCNEGCVGPTCFLLDQAIFLLANGAVQLPGGGNSAGQLAKTRTDANKQTWRLFPNYTSFGSTHECPNSRIAHLT